ncbi:MAG: alpha/beta fold hydrolase [Dehalococcoidia bacterium]
MRNIIAATILALTGASLAVWYLARRIERDVFRATPAAPEPLDLTVAAVGPESVTMRPRTAGARAAARQPGVYGLQYLEGYGQLGEILSDDAAANAIERRFELIYGQPPRPGDGARVDSFAFPLDPHVAHALEWEAVDVPSGGRSNPAWLLPGEASHWAILVHGKGARREEALRLLPLLHADGWASLTISYLNDTDCEQTGTYQFGATEWEDLETAAGFAVNRGATEILLVGYSMGGAIVLSFLARSSHAGLVRGLILDAPMTNLEEIVRIRSKRMRVPGRLLAPAMRRAVRAARLDWPHLDYHSAWNRDDLPVLLFHGDADAVIPVSLSDTFAAGRPNITYHRVPQAGHVRCWNTDRPRYESAVRDFLASLCVVPAPVSPSPRARGEGAGG